MSSVRRFLPLALAVALLAPLQTFAGTVISVTDFGATADSGQDATAAFQNAISAVKTAGGPTTLRIPPGRYDFFSPQAHRRACYLSNATESGSDAVRTIALDLTDIDGLTIEGNGARLVMRGMMTMLVAERCSGLTLQDLEFDFARPTFSEITAVEKGAGFWIGRVHPDSTFRIVGGNRIEWFGEDWSRFHNLVQHYDPATRSVWRGADPTANASSITDLGEGRVRFQVPQASLDQAVAGRTYQFRDTTRNQSGMWFNRSRDVKLQDVKVRAMHGFGMLFQFTENVSIERLEVAPTATSGRTCASPADVLHFSGCKGLVRIEDSKLTAAHDDALNVHGTHLRVVARPAADQIRVRFMHAQSWGFQAFVEGDEIEFVKKATLLPLGQAVVTGVQMTTDPREQLLTLDRAAPAGLQIGSDAVENVTWTPSVEMTGCDIAQIPTRGILLTTRRPILIQGNRFFRTQMPAILVEDDAAGWYESGPVHDLAVRGNSFFECGESVISLNPENTTSAGAVHRNIRIEDNLFTLQGNGAVGAKSTADLKIAGNLFRMRADTSPPQQNLVSTTDTSGLVVAGNTVVPASTAALAVKNGGFEDTAAGRTPWFAVPAAGVLSLAREAPASGRLIGLDGGARIYQELGGYDPTQGSQLRWSLEQIAIAGAGAALEVSFHVGDGRFAGADERDIAPLPAWSTRTFAGWSGTSRTLSGSIDLSGLAAGSRLWMRVAAPQTDARIDQISVETGAAPDPSRYSGWIQTHGLSGADATPEADPDGDGLPNLVEYLLEQTDPLRSDTGALQGLLRQTDGRPVFRYRPRPTQDAVLVAEYQMGALDPAGWRPVVDGIDGLTLRTDLDGIHWIETVATLADKLFIRLSAGFLPPPPVQVVNGGFESPDQTGQANAYTGASPSGWTFISPVNGGVEEIRDARFGPVGAEGQRLVAAGGEGDQVGFINLGNSGSASATSDGVGMVAPDTVYTLKIAFAQRTSGDRHPDGGFGLLAGGQPLGAFVNFTGPSLQAGFNELVFTWTSPAAGDPIIGQPLQIRMNFSYSATSGGWQQAQFDKVRLEAVARP